MGFKWPLIGKRPYTAPLLAVLKGPDVRKWRRHYHLVVALSTNMFSISPEIRAARCWSVLLLSQEEEMF